MVEQKINQLNRLGVPIGYWDGILTPNRWYYKGQFDLHGNGNFTGFTKTINDSKYSLSTRLNGYYVINNQILGYDELHLNDGILIISFYFR